MELLIIIGLVYLAFHLGHSHSRFRAAYRHPWWRRIWISVPGPFGVRISKRL